MTDETIMMLQNENRALRDTVTAKNQALDISVQELEACKVRLTHLSDFDYASKLQTSIDHLKHFID